MITNENVITDPHELLAYAIVDSMKEDYIKALERNDKDEIYICEEFFKSDYCKILLILTDVTGESIMKECRRVAKNGNDIV